MLFYKYAKKSLKYSSIELEFGFTQDKNDLSKDNKGAGTT